MRHAAVVAGLALGLMSGTAKAAFVFDITQESNGISVTGSGSFDLSAAQFSTSGSSGSYIDPSASAVVIQHNNANLYTVDFTSFSSFGSGGLMVSGSASGPDAGFNAANNRDFLIVPVGYTSRSLITGSSAFYNGLTFANAGIDPGIYNYTYETSTGTDTITVDASFGSTVPLPASAPMFGAALIALGAVGYGLKRKSKAATAA